MGAVETRGVPPSEDDGVGTLLPSQVVRTPSLAALSPEARLALAVLEDGVATYVAARRLSGSGAARIARAEWAWINERNSSWPFAFERLCHHVGLDPDCVRSRLGRRFGEIAVLPLSRRRSRRRSARPGGYVA
jgi:hypothetical protein